MQLARFKYQDKETKQRLILKHGSYLTRRRTKEHLVFLFAVGSFYVELFFDEEEEMIVYIRSFENTDELAVYFSQIDISSVLKDTVYSS
jgi:hypothetical protein